MHSQTKIINKDHDNGYFLSKFSEWVVIKYPSLRPAPVFFPPLYVAFIKKQQIQKRVHAEKRLHKKNYRLLSCKFFMCIIKYR